MSNKFANRANMIVGIPFVCGVNLVLPIEERKRGGEEARKRGGKEARLANLEVCKPCFNSVQLFNFNSFETI